MSHPQTASLDMGSECYYHWAGRIKKTRENASEIRTYPQGGSAEAAAASAGGKESKLRLLFLILPCSERVGEKSLQQLIECSADISQEGSDCFSGMR